MHQFLINDWVRLEEGFGSGPFLHYVVKIIGLDGDLATVLVDSGQKIQVHVRFFTPCVRPGDVKIGDWIEPISISWRKRWGQKAEVLDIHAPKSLMIRFEDGAVLVISCWSAKLLSSAFREVPLLGGATQLSFL